MNTVSDKLCLPHQQLLDTIARCQSELNRYPDDDPGHHRAREILTALAQHSRRVAGVFDTDPTLAGEPYETGRFRAIDLFAELARQTIYLLRSACGNVRLDRWPREMRWAETEAIFARAEHYADVIPQIVPRRDHACEAGSQAISRNRLAAHAHDLAVAAQGIQASVEAALRMPHPDPQALALAQLADQLAHQATELAAHHQEQSHALAVACGMPGATDDSAKAS